MNNLLFQFRASIIFLIDVLVGFASLFLMVLFRYGADNFYPHLNAHLVPFIVIIFLFILSFYIFNLYSFRFNRNITEFNGSFIKSILLSFAISIIVFYIFGDFFKVTPKTNLVIFTGIFGTIDFYLRILIRRYYSKKKINRKIVIISKEKNNLVDEIRNNQNIGYEILKETDSLEYDEILKLNPDIVVTDLENTELTSLYPLVQKDIAIYTVHSFYEETFQKIPIDVLEKSRIIEYISKNKTFFIFLKRLLDISISLVFLIILLPFFVLISLLIKLTSKGPVFFKQTRVSMHDTLFTIYKFRSMRIDAEKDGAVWTKDDKTDNRITVVGRILRKSHFDEIPQLINILRGDISFVGPRPERPEFTKMLEEEIMYYTFRHSVKPGLTGWAQINYRYGSSVEDTKEKLKYDFYYIKNRNIFLDILILLKTVAMVFQKH